MMNLLVQSAAIGLAIVGQAFAHAQVVPAVSVAQNIVDLQMFRSSESTPWVDASGHFGIATLTNLNTQINVEFLLTLHWPGQIQDLAYHIENPAASAQTVSLDAQHPGELAISAGGTTVRCPLAQGETLSSAGRMPLAFVPLCGGLLYLRNPVRGNRTVLEATTQFLRDHVWHGEQIVGFVRRGFYQDAFIERADPVAGVAIGPGDPASAAGPAPARMAKNADLQAVQPQGLGIEVATRHGLTPGQWYGAAGMEGVYVSVVQPGDLANADTVAAGRNRELDSVESGALTFLVAFDASRFELGFALGTEHPRLSWSARAREDMRDARLPGPDGFATPAPLVRAGMVNPAFQPRVVATFTGGFKREHGAFKYGSLASINRASHYGFVEQGVVYSRLNPGLSTLFVLRDGTLGMKTWSQEDDPLLRKIRHARQNGVPLIERNPSGGSPVWGPLVDAWGPGNWSGSADEKLRTLRSGACMVDHGGRRFLVYAYFSSATPRAMARVFSAYGCEYAMHLDMNALEHTYLALYTRSGDRMRVEHLVKGMAELDKGTDQALVPRFLGFADDRDFFYLMARKADK